MIIAKTTGKRESRWPWEMIKADRLDVLIFHEAGTATVALHMNLLS